MTGNRPLVIKTTPRLSHVCAGCCGGSNLHIQIHALFAHAGLAARDRRDRRGPGAPAHSEGQSPHSKRFTWHAKPM
ncbi:hypothetical protein HaLaN_03679 [Haematococcus lacustris]|uniref:Uncharacterized protein n=1 Tax=Haematococcus lacustris TaxID=44745 RepID=A0A699YR53_HAELA|nr:hypothetical protein HaLaN_03679 [Haematococcus lacustris]